MYSQTSQRLLTESLHKYKNRTAILYSGQSLTYDELRKSANKISNAMIARGIGRAKKCVLFMKNRPEYLMCDVAINKSGAVKMTLNEQLGEEEVLFILNHSQAEMIIVDEIGIEMIHKIKGEVPSLQHFISLAAKENTPEGFIQFEDFYANEQDVDPPLNASTEDVIRLGYTGGTTGLPKGIEHIQGSNYLNLLAHVIETEINESDRILIMTPLPHSAGSFAQTGLIRGATIVIEANFDPKKMLRLIDEEKITFTFMVPTMIYRVIDEYNNAKDKFDISSLRTIFYGAAPITMSRLEQGLEIFGPVFVQLFGQSECPNFITKLTKEDHIVDENSAERLKSCGRPALMATVKIIDNEGNDLPTGEVGEIACQSPYVMKGYYDDPEKTAETIVDGWLLTGDIGKIDEEGYVYLLDRKNDMIISGGLNVYTTEVESVIQRHEKVQQVAVIGVPHDDWGETVLAKVIPKDNSITEEELISYCRERLAAYKCPKVVEFVTEFPLTPYGKLDKKTLRAPYWGTGERSIN